MEKLQIESTRNTPFIYFSWSGVFLISGRSLNDDCDIYYIPIIKYIKKYKEESKRGVLFIFDFEYFNTISAHYIRNIIEELVNISKLERKVKVYWYYDSIDEVMGELGETFKEQYEKKSSNFHFTLISKCSDLN